MPSYGTTLLPFQDVQPTVQPTLQQIEQAMDITMEPAGKMLSCKVSAAVRLQAAARGLLARRLLQEMCGLLGSRGESRGERRQSYRTRDATVPAGTVHVREADDRRLRL
jgi:hypothetical protein